MSIVIFPRRQFRPAPPASTGLPANVDVAVHGSTTVGMLLEPDQRLDPAALVAIAVRFAVMGQVDGTGVPPVIRGALRAHAAAGSGACLAVLDWLDRRLLTQLEDEEVSHD